MLNSSVHGLRSSACAVLVSVLFWHSSFAAERPHLLIQPSNIELRGKDAEHGFLVTLVNADGSTEDVTEKAKVESVDARLFTVDGVNCRALANGSGLLSASYEGLTASAQVQVAQHEEKVPTSFRQDVIPVFTRYGCNAGACHGKLAGQNSFRLSLRGYAPEWDHEWLTKEVNSRRIDFADADASLLIQKPLGHVPHEGGRRFDENSKAHRVLRDWIVSRAPAPNPLERDAEKLVVYPGHRTLKPGQMQRLLVEAIYADGRKRDVTWLCKFVSNDESAVRVDENGMVKALRPGESAVRVHFQGQVEVVLMTIPYEKPVDASFYAVTQNQLDAPVLEKLRGLHIPPSGRADDATFARRAFLDVIGTLPSTEEVEKFVSSAAKDKRAKLIDDLLERPEFVDYWTLQFCDLLQNRKERDHDVRGAKGVRDFYYWVHEKLARNTPWNQMAHEILTASGDVISHPEIGYYIYTIGEKHAFESDIPDSVAQSFLGTRIGCARCHNHPLERYTQDDYYHFTAFFSRVSLKRENPNKKPTELMPWTDDEERKRNEIRQAQDKLEETKGSKLVDAEKAKKIEEQQKRIEQLGKELVDLRKNRSAGVTQPRTHQFLAPQPLDRAKIAGDSDDPRLALADWITSTNNPAFSGSMVNRLWKHFMSVGLVEPVDDLRASNPPSNPHLWKVLNEEFVAHNYDIKHVMRLILNSRVYQFSSETQSDNETDRRFYSHYFARRLPAEVLLDAIAEATGVPDKFAGYPEGTRAIQMPDPGISSYFLTLFGRSERVTACACERSGDVTLPQLLHLHNGEDMSKKLASNESRLAAILKAEKTPEGIANQIFVTTLARKPSAKETETLAKALAEAEKPEEVYRDLFWAILNTKEFAFNH